MTENHVRATGFRAAGNLTHLVVDTRWVFSLIAGTRIGAILWIANGRNLVNNSLCHEGGETMAARGG
jgi:hypothetical protein